MISGKISLSSRGGGLFRPSGAPKIRIFEQVFAIIFWFIILPGPSGAIVYFVSLSYIQNLSSDDFVEKNGIKSILSAHRFMEWIPERIFAASLAVAGNFDDAIVAWGKHNKDLRLKNEGNSYLIAAAGALGISVTYVAEDTAVEKEHVERQFKLELDSEKLLKLTRLVSRVFFMWMGVIGCFTFFSLF